MQKSGCCCRQSFQIIGNILRASYYQLRESTQTMDSCFFVRSYRSQNVSPTYLAAQKLPTFAAKLVNTMINLRRHLLLYAFDRVCLYATMPLCHRMGIQPQQKKKQKKNTNTNTPVLCACLSLSMITIIGIGVFILVTFSLSIGIDW